MPFIDGWIEQMYGKLPAWSNVALKVPSVSNRPLDLGPPAWNVTVWGAASPFVHVTVVPTLTSRSAGTKANPAMSTVAPDATLAPGAEPLADAAGDAGAAGEGEAGDVSVAAGLGVVAAVGDGAVAPPLAHAARATDAARATAAQAAARPTAVRQDRTTGCTDVSSGRGVRRWAIRGPVGSGFGDAGGVARGATG